MIAEIIYSWNSFIWWDEALDIISNKRLNHKIKKSSVQNSFILGTHLLSQMKPYIILRMKNESANITDNIQNWYRKCFIHWIPLFSKMKLKIFFRMKNETTSIAINIQKWFYTFFSLPSAEEALTDFHDQEIVPFFVSELFYQCDKIWTK